MQLPSHSPLENVSVLEDISKALVASHSLREPSKDQTLQLGIETDAIQRVEVHQQPLPQFYEWFPLLQRNPLNYSRFGGQRVILPPPLDTAFDSFVKQGKPFILAQSFPRQRSIMAPANAVMQALSIKAEPSTVIFEPTVTFEEIRDDRTFEKLEKDAPLETSATMPETKPPSGGKTKNTSDAGSMLYNIVYAINFIAGGSDIEFLWNRK